jgi:hypothetical protein
MRPFLLSETEAAFIANLRKIGEPLLLDLSAMVERAATEDEAKRVPVQPASVKLHAVK